MNESDTRLHKIDPKLKAAGWGVTEGSRITTEKNQGDRFLDEFPEFIQKPVPLIPSLILKFLIKNGESRGIFPLYNRRTRKM